MVLTTAKSDGMKAFVLEEGREMIWMEGTGDYIIYNGKLNNWDQYSILVSQLCSIVVDLKRSVLTIDENNRGSLSKHQEHARECSH
jgi:hypothetical protein